MNARATFSAKGQIVIPKDVRDRYRFTNGQVVDVVETPEGVLLRTPSRQKAASYAEAVERMRQAIGYSGPPLGEEEWQAGIAKAIKEKWAKRRP